MDLPPKRIILCSMTSFKKFGFHTTALEVVEGFDLSGTFPVPYLHRTTISAVQIKVLPTVRSSVRLYALLINFHLDVLNIGSNHCVYLDAFCRVSCVSQPSGRDFY